MLKIKLGVSKLKDHDGYVLRIADLNNKFKLSNSTIIKTHCIINHYTIHRSRKNIYYIGFGNASKEDINDIIIHLKNIAKTHNDIIIEDQ